MLNVDHGLHFSNLHTQTSSTTNAKNKNTEAYHIPPPPLRHKWKSNQFPKWLLSWFCGYTAMVCEVVYAYVTAVNWVWCAVQCKVIVRNLWSNIAPNIVSSAILYFLLLLFYSVVPSHVQFYVWFSFSSVFPPESPLAFGSLVNPAFSSRLPYAATSTHSIGPYAAWHFCG